ncbi:MAG: peptigoglycan-binding protein LysM, partial [Psychrobacter sp.]|nr:peptigoglycan-binding protein LysM [Psychrobacter sp.]
MNFSRQALLGIGMILGGSVMLYAMVQQVGSNDEEQPTVAMIEDETTEQEPQQPLTTDVETEKRILAQKQEERAARVAAQQERAQQFLTEQEAAEAQALEKARAESQQYVSNTTTSDDNIDSAEAAQSVIDTPTVQRRTDNQTATAESTNEENDQAANRQAVIR